MDAGPLLEALIVDLRATDPSRRNPACERLTRLGPAARGASIPLVEMSGQDGTVGQAVRRTLEQMGPPLVGDLGQLAELAGHPTPQVASWAVTLLGRLGPPAAPVTAVLSRLLTTSEHLHVRRQAAWALGRIGPAARPAVGSLREAQQLADSRLARMVEKALAEIEPSPSPATPSEDVSDNP